MNAGDKAECREIGREIVTEVLKIHIKTCPHHTAFLISKARIVGIILGVVAASGVSSAAAVSLIMKVFTQ